MIVLLGNTAPIQMVRRKVDGLSRDQLESQAFSLLKPTTVDVGANGEAVARLMTAEEKRAWIQDHADEELRERIAECRVTEDLEAHNNESITEVLIPDGTPMKRAVNIVQNVWSQHSKAAPAWIEADNEKLQLLLLTAFDEDGEGGPASVCPADWMTDKDGKPPFRAWPGLNTLAVMASIGMLAMTFLATRMMLRTNEGRNFQARVMGNGVAAGAGTGTMRPADYLAITENSTAPALADTVLTGELTGGGLGRSQAAFAHTAASTTYTLIFEWTSSDGTPRTINKMGVFNASSSGSLVFTSLVPSPPTLVAGDKLEITSTVDIS